MNKVLFSAPPKIPAKRVFFFSAFLNKLKRSINRFNILRILKKTVKNLLKNWELQIVYRCRKKYFETISIETHTPLLEFKLLIY